MMPSERAVVASGPRPSQIASRAVRTGGGVREKVVQFGRASALVGIVTDPPADANDPSRPGVILLNAGLLHRIGPNRLYVELARRLATTGLVVLRFDFSGIGDSEARGDDLPFEQSAIRETQEAMTFLSETRGVQQFVLAGLCTGAVNAFHTAREDSRAVGAVLLNPLGFNAESRSLVHAHLYWEAVSSVLRSPRRWLGAISRHLRVRIMLRHLQRVLARRESVGALEAEFRSVVERGVALLVLFSSPHDPGMRELELVVGDRLEQLTGSGHVTFETLEDATHTFHSLTHQAMLLDIIDRWIRGVP
jgi:dienelactone hydrolase